MHLKVVELKTFDLVQVFNYHDLEFHQVLVYALAEAVKIAWDYIPHILQSMQSGLSEDMVFN